MRCLFDFYVPKTKMWVPCGKCHDCRERKRIEWTIRLTHEGQYSKNNFFLTCTYKDESLPILSQGEITRLGDPGLDLSLPHVQTLYPRDHETFMKRLRIYQRRHGKLSSHKIRFYMTAEYGTSYTARPHFHYILFGLDPSIKTKLAEIWSHGNIKLGSVAKASIHYVAAHQHKKWVKPEGAIAPFTRMSKALGQEYIKQNYNLHKATSKNPIPNGKVQVNGHTHVLPRYYKDRIFNKFERDYLRDEAKRESADYRDSSEQSYEEELEAYQDRRRRQLKKTLNSKL